MHGLSLSWPNAFSTFKIAPELNCYYGILSLLSQEVACCRVHRNILFHFLTTFLLQIAVHSRFFCWVRRELIILWNMEEQSAPYKEESTGPVSRRTTVRKRHTNHFLGRNWEIAMLDQIYNRKAYISPTKNLSWLQLSSVMGILYWC